MKAKFQHYDLRLVEPSFSSPLTSLIIELDHLLKKKLFGTTRPELFFQLKTIFHTLESIGSARIEGNNTTIAEVIENKIEKPTKRPPGLTEIANMEKAMQFIDEKIDKIKIDKLLICELHKMVVKKLPLPPEGEGDSTPGIYRNHSIKIKGSSHIPPELQSQVTQYMDELIEFINNDDEQQYNLLKVALAHHRFMWIHPFGNGNGRTGRLLTYAMLIKQGFAVSKQRIVNPTAVFCSNRDAYYYHLSNADKGSEKDLLKWCEFVLTGLKVEIDKIDRLLDYDFLKNKIFLPALEDANKKKLITATELAILKLAVTKETQIIQAADIKTNVLKGKLPAEVSRVIARLRKNKMLSPIKPNSRKYYIRFDNNYLLRSIFLMLDKNGFLPVKDEDGKRTN